MTISNISSKATGPIVTKSHLEPPWAEGTKICSNEQYGHHTHIQSNFGRSNVSFSNPSESSKTAVGPEFSAINFMHFSLGKFKRG